MAAPKSILQRVEVDTAKHAHNCQHNAKHRVEGGAVRLKVHTLRSSEHFCRECAIKIIDRDIARLRQLRGELAADDGGPDAH